MKEMHFDYRDVFRAPRLALSLKKIWIHFIALVWGLFFYNILTYLAIFVAGASQGASIDIFTLLKVGALNYGFFPCPFAGIFTGVLGDQFLPWLIWGVGLLILALYWFLARGAVAKVTVEQLKGNDFYTRREAKKFVGKNWKAMVFAPIALLIILGLMYAGGILLGLIASIPAVGHILATLFLFPFYAIALFYVFLLGVFMVSAFLSPVIVASTRNDVFETIFELYTTLSNQPWRLFTYEVLLKVISGVAVMLFGAISVAGLNVLFMSYAVVIADKIALLVPKALQFLPPIGIFFKGLCTTALMGVSPTYYIPGRFGSFAPMSWADVFYNPAIYSGGSYISLPDFDVTYKIAAVLLGITLNLVICFIMSYGLAIGSVGQTIIYVVLRKKKDDEDLLERIDEDMEEIIPSDVTETKPEATPETKPADSN